MSEQRLDIFNALNFINNGYELEYILENGRFSTFSSPQECIDFLINGGYLEGGSETVTAESISKKYKVAELKELLKKHGLKVSGKKQELVERIFPVLSESSDDLTMTDKAIEFLEENEWIDLYKFALIQFSFDDYETFVNQSSVDMIQTAHNFCDEITSRALMRNHFLVFRLALSAKAHVYAYAGDYDSFMDYDLQHFILGLNPIMLNAQDYPKYEIVNNANVINLKRVMETLDMGSLKKRFDRIWDKSHIKNITVPKKTCYKILLKAIEGADVDEINFDLRQKYFDKKFGI